MEQKIIYLDNNATTQVAPEVLEVMLPFFTERYGNPSSIHRFGGTVAAEVEHARCAVADLLGADYRDENGNATEIIFTSCGTESDNSALNAALQLSPERRKVVTTAVEHPAILHFCDELRHRGYQIAVIPVDGFGRLDMESLRREVDENTAVVSAMWGNNETGTIFPVREIAEIAHARGALCHTDAVQAVGKVKIDVREAGVDMLSLSGHKLHAPKGVGALYVRRGVRFTPLIFGGHQERQRRGGTENVASVIGLGKACELSALSLEAEIGKLRSLRDAFEAKVLATVPQVRINGDLENRLPGTSSISFEYIEGESILMLLDVHGICASSGSACTTGSLEPSHVLRAMGIPYSAAHGTIRFSLSRYNTGAELDFTAEKLPAIISRLRAISPYWNGAVR